MANEVNFRHKETGEVKSVKVGWSWTLFFFGAVLGIPFFMRKATTLGFMMVGWNCFCLILTAMGTGDELVRFGGVGLSVALGMFGNQKTAEYYLQHGWALEDPNGEMAQLATEKWKLA